MPGTNLCLVANSAAVLSRACAAEHRRHGVSAFCSLTVFVSMVHCRSPMGAWKHAQRSYNRGYLARPLVFYGDELLPPPPPPVFYGVELSGIRNRMDWNDLCDENEDILETLEKDCPPGAVTYFVDAPLAAKDISLPKAFCLTLLLEPKAETIFGSLLEPPSTRVYADCALEGIAETTPEVLPRNHYCIRRQTS